MHESTFRLEILAPIKNVWKALSTTEGMNAWAPWLRVDSNWEVNSPIVLTCTTDNGEVMEYNGEKMIFNAILDVKTENKEITYSYPEKLVGIEKESYVLEEIDTSLTGLTFTQTCISEEIANGQEDSQNQSLRALKAKLEEN